MSYTKFSIVGQVDTGNAEVVVTLYENSIPGHLTSIFDLGGVANFLYHADGVQAKEAFGPCTNALLDMCTEPLKYKKEYAGNKQEQADAYANALFYLADIIKALADYPNALIRRLGEPDDETNQAG